MATKASETEHCEQTATSVFFFGNTNFTTSCKQTVQTVCFRTLLTCSFLIQSWAESGVSAARVYTCDSELRGQKEARA